MSGVKFQHVFVMLMLTAVVSGFVVQPRFGDRAKGPFQAVFWPVAAPARRVAQWARARFERVEAPVVAGPRGRALSEAEVQRQNDELRQAVTALTAQLEELRKKDAEFERLGEARPYCTRLAVFGADSGLRQSLLVSTRGAEAVRVGMPVLYAHGIAGRIESAGVGSAQVKLVTDGGFRVSGGFRRFVQEAGGRPGSKALETAQPPLVEGDGRGRMLIRNIDMKEVTAIKLQPGDWVVLNDTGPDWPEVVQGYKLGEVVSVRPRTDQPLYAQVEVSPKGNLMQLREVMVMNKR